ncbi:ATP-binding cassette domain-containing protein [Consotaella aegiceratis]|uniref:ATP-binding cassette domain-containing protein n=1 Tax=Consotaella aegiceratis TaxID=3097961 RepID=UPI002F3FA2A8
MAGLALLSAVLLTGVSGWFLAAVALAGAGPAALTFNFHVPGALVRLFAITRTLSKYGERLTGHRAALIDQVDRRRRIFGAMAEAPETRAAGWQLGREDRLVDWLEDVEDVDFERLRVGFPAVTLAAGFALLAAVTFVVVPLAIVPILILVAILAGLARRAGRILGDAETEKRRSRRDGAARLGAMLQSLIPLAAERRRRMMAAEAMAPLGIAEKAMIRQRRTIADLDLGAGLFGPVAFLSVLLVGAAGARGEELLPAIFVAFGWLAYAEAAAGLSRILVGRTKARQASQALARWTNPAPTANVPATRRMQEIATAKRVADINLVGLHLMTATGRPIGEPLTVRLRRGEPTVLIGASGTGKTTLLKTIAGWLDPAEGELLVNGQLVADADRRDLVHLALHDATVLLDTVRANLFAEGTDESTIRQALETVELTERVEQAGGIDAWIAQDRLSLGEAQRLNLARALLAEEPVVLLDEPTEHLDAAQAKRLLARISRHCADRMLVYSSHSADRLDADVRFIRLDHGA